ncbi:MAG: hypothetical protein ACJATI_001583 [Halioglobus sp.]|jgi:hypothetical protein
MQEHLFMTPTQASENLSIKCCFSVISLIFAFKEYLNAIDKLPPFENCTDEEVVIL